MQKINSNQKNVRFVFCSSPITIDKRSEWGNSHENFQRAPNGAFLKCSSETEVSHLVQPNRERTAPVGWIAGNEPGLFDKAPIWIEDDNVLQIGGKITLDTLDGEITYDVQELSFVCYNDKNGKPDLEDSWIQSIQQIEKNYVYTAPATS